MWIMINRGKHWIKKCNVVQSRVYGPICVLDCTTGETPYKEKIEIGGTVSFKLDTGHGLWAWGKSIRIDSAEDMMSVINMIQTRLALEEL